MTPPPRTTHNPQPTTTITRDKQPTTTITHDKQPTTTITRDRLAAMVAAGFSSDRRRLDNLFAAPASGGRSEGAAIVATVLECVCSNPRLPLSGKRGLGECVRGRVRGSVGMTLLLRCQRGVWLRVRYSDLHHTGVRCAIGIICVACHLTWPPLFSCLFFLTTTSARSLGTVAGVCVQRGGHWRRP